VEKIKGERRKKLGKHVAPENTMKPKPCLVFIMYLTFRQANRCIRKKKNITFSNEIII
jgi:hypothetical protein